MPPKITFLNPQIGRVHPSSLSQRRDSTGRYGSTRLRLALCLAGQFFSEDDVLKHLK
jgi:hypothetical protein